MKRYYVYILLDDRQTGNYDNKYVKVGLKPFYVGKGDKLAKNNGKRHLLHYKKVINKSELDEKSNPHKFRLIRVLLESGFEPNFVFAFESENEQEAFEVEKELISFYGKDKNGGLLTNITDGGSGGNTIDYVEGLKDKLMLINKDKWLGQNNPNFNKPLEESYSHLSKLSGNHWNKGRKISEETIMKIQKNRINFVRSVVRINPITLEELETLKTLDAIKKYNLSKGSFNRAINKGGSCGGYYWRYTDTELVFTKTKKDGYIKPEPKEKKRKKVFYKKNWSDEEIFFLTLTEASEKTGFHANTISNKCRLGTSLKEHFFRYEDTEYKIREIKDIKQKIKRTSPEGEIKIYESMTEAAKDIENGKITSVLAVCKGRNKTYKKFKFEYI